MKDTLETATEQSCSELQIFAVDENVDCRGEGEETVAWLDDVLGPLWSHLQWTIVQHLRKTRKIFWKFNINGIFHEGYLWVKNIFVHFYIYFPILNPFLTTYIVWNTNLITLIAVDDCLWCVTNNLNNNYSSQQDWHGLVPPKQDIVKNYWRKLKMLTLHEWWLCSIWLSVVSWSRRRLLFYHIENQFSKSPLWYFCWDMQELWLGWFLWKVNETRVIRW